MWFVLFALLILSYEKVLMPTLCEKRINTYIKNIGAKTCDIEKFSVRKSIYYVSYIKDKKIHNTVVKFNFFLKAKWE